MMLNPTPNGQHCTSLYEPMRAVRPPNLFVRMLSCAGWHAGLINAKMHFDARAVVAYDPPVADLANWLCRSARVEEVLRMKHTAARSKSDASSRSERRNTTR